MTYIHNNSKTCYVQPPKKDVTDTALENAMEMDYDKPLQDDGFGGAVGEGLLGMYAHSR